MTTCPLNAPPPVAFVYAADRPDEIAPLRQLPPLASAEASGGSCRSGAVSAGLSAAYTNATGGGAFKGQVVMGTIEHSMLGGFASVASGGKFADGARAGAFGYLFNACAHGQCGSSPEENGAPVGISYEGANEATLSIGLGRSLGPIGAGSLSVGMSFEGLLPNDIGLITNYSLPITSGLMAQYGGTVVGSFYPESMRSMNNTMSMSYGIGLGQWGGGFETGQAGGFSGANITWGAINIGVRGQGQMTRTTTLQGWISSGALRSYPRCGQGGGC
jgi:hypothetical protein